MLLTMSSVKFFGVQSEIPDASGFFCYLINVVTLLMSSVKFLNLKQAQKKIIIKILFNTLFFCGRSSAITKCRTFFNHWL